MRLWNAIAQANGGVDFAIALTLLLVVPFAIALARRVALRLLAPGIAAEFAAATSAWLLLPLATYAAILALDVPPRVERVAAAVALVAVVVQAGLWAHRALSHWLSLRFERTRAQDPQAATTLKLIGYAVQGLLWLLVVLLALDQLGFDVTALVAGLGIGGVAIALAVQSVLGDLFACAAIALDKPFVVGDFIVVDDLRGTVESIGLKTTRVRSLDGELLVFSNGDLLRAACATSSACRNGASSSRSASPTARGPRSCGGSRAGCARRSRRSRRRVSTARISRATAIPRSTSKWSIT